MGFIFRKSIKLAPGVRLNFSKNGMSSVSFGGKGGRVSVGSKRTTTTVGIPGTGIRYQTSKSHTHRNSMSTNSQGYSTSNNELGTQWGCAFLLIGIFLFLGFLLIGQKIGWAFGSLGLGVFLYFLLSGVIRNSFSKKSNEVKSATITDINTISSDTNVAQAKYQAQANDLYNRISDDTKCYFSKLDPLLIDAIVAVFCKNNTVSSIQRKLNISFTHAVRLIEWIEQIGLISQKTDNGSRTLLVSSEDLPVALDSIDLSTLIKDNDNRLNAIAKQATFEFELPRRKQIYEESVKLMQTTQVFSTLSRRYEDVINFINWATEMKDAGCSCNVNMTREDAITQANDCFNEGIYRVCKTTIEAADSPRKRQNATEKIQMIEQSLKESPNKDQIKSNIYALIGINTNNDINFTQNN